MLLEAHPLSSSQRHALAEVERGLRKRPREHMHHTLIAIRLAVQDLELGFIRDEEDCP